MKLTDAFLLIVAAFIGMLVLYGAINNYAVQPWKPEMDVQYQRSDDFKQPVVIPKPKQIERPFDLYIMNGYLIKDDEIRITLLTKCKYFANLTLQTSEQGKEGMLLPISLELVENCPSGWMPKCLHSGQYGTVKIPNGLDLQPYLEGKKSFSIGYKDDPANRRPIKLIDSRVREGQKKEHKLAVCPFPIVLMAEWTMLAQFFEQWIEHGATKFYFVYQSVSKEFDSMLRIYERDPSISIERVNWSVMPLRKGMTPEEDPNGQIMRAEEVFAVNDCILRARGRAEYIAIFDFDETIVVYKNLSLLTLLDDRYAAENNIGAFLFRSSYARFENRWLNASNPKQLNFSIYDNILLENRTLDAGSMSKIILKPERVKSQSVHYVLTMEDSKYITHNFDIVVSKIYHLRLVYWDEPDKNKFFPNNTLQKYTPKWTERYAKRLNDEEKRLETAKPASYLTLKDQNWATRGNAVMREVEACHRRMFDHRDQTCPAHYKCVGNLTTIRPEEWIFVDQSWIVL